MDHNCVILHDAQQHAWLLFRQPIAIYTAHDIDQVTQQLAQAEQHGHQTQSWVVGWVSYEAAPAFDPALVVRSSSFPLLWLGIYAEPEVIDLDQLAGASPAANVQSIHWHPSLSVTEYEHAIGQIKQFIRQGDTYQVNYTHRLQAIVPDPIALFTHMLRAQPCPYGALVQTADWTVCCASPELFFQRDGNTLISRPMKGTLPRGLGYEDDRQNQLHLQYGEKNRAENVMIVDMVRNDMAHVADIGSVQVPQLFAVEQYPTVWQMTSTVSCTTSANTTAIFAALFPPASITGAPKPRTMRIIAELEPSARKLYTGTIGFISPHGRSQFNVAIRTVLVDRQTQQAEYGVGGGIVWDSTATAEFAECQAKARVLTTTIPDFSLLETLRWTPEEGFFLLDRHFDRLRKSANYFAYPVDLNQLREQLLMATHTLPAQPHKVRVQVTNTGMATIEIQPLPLTPQPYRLKLATQPIDSSNPYLYHKTTHRPMYDQALQSAPGWDDVLLWNERGEVTESCIANVIVERNGEWFTPPTRCGLLAGVYRSALLEQGKIQETVIAVDELDSYSQICLINSIRQLWNVVIDR
ncbi:MAG: aminodeoxychorismate synthase component I [Leptolyngbyaceae cyanobacterium SL_7_1]|nr:aminodeoxychorismate synthase component I [Leptolyngbyaceae cyanobacterium SL_7_1]